jgi:hypothetical protein
MVRLRRAKSSYYESLRLSRSRLCNSPISNNRSLTGEARTEYYYANLCAFVNWARIYLVALYDGSIIMNRCLLHLKK